MSAWFACLSFEVSASTDSLYCTLLCVFLASVISYIYVAYFHIIVFVMAQDEEGEVISRLEVFNSVEVLAPGIELDDVDSLLNSGESNFSSAVTCIKYVFLDI
jgi:hypothetical protein